MVVNNCEWGTFSGSLPILVWGIEPILGELQGEHFTQLASIVLCALALS